jgi:rod shape-determining protein MreC
MLVLVSVTIITLDYRGDARSSITSTRDAARDVFAPLQRAVADALHPVGDFFSGAVNYGQAQAENAVLQKEIGQMQRELAESGAAAAQLKQISSTLNLPFVENISTVAAQVIVGEPSNFDLTVEIDKGTADGVGVGMPVIAGAGLAGTVTSAGSQTATVQLITDASSSIGVRFGGNQIAVVQGQGPTSPLLLEFVQAGESATKGEKVYTSGLLGAAYPSDIPIGTVSSVRFTPGSYTKVATVQPFVNFSNLQYMSVLQWLPPA